MKNYRRVLCALMLVLCLVGSMPVSADAASVFEGDYQIDPYYTGTLTISASISILASGEAKCWGHVDCLPGYTADAVMRLQWLDGDIWRNYESWYGEDGRAVDFYEVYPLIKGRTYRVRVIGDIFDSEGHWVEMVDAVSGSAKY